jgi:hypothetical protein
MWWHLQIARYVTLLNSCKICFLAQQSTTKSDSKSQDLNETEANTTTVNETDVQQFKEWLENYLKQRKLHMHSF